MGIRYYAYPVDADLVEVAQTSPRSFLSEDPLMDAWGPLDEKPPMLYLDKCWRELQVLLGSDGARPERPALRLVAGQVTHTAEGWIPYIAVLDPVQVAEISKDLATITPAEVRSVLAVNNWIGYRENVEEELDYVNHYLSDALIFSTELSMRGDGLVYMIG